MPVAAAATDLTGLEFRLALSREASQPLDPSGDQLRIKSLSDQLRGAPQDLTLGSVGLARQSPRHKAAHPSRGSSRSSQGLDLSPHGPNLGHQPTSIGQRHAVETIADQPFEGVADRLWQLPALKP
jgi:hypothetical protein